MRACIMAFGLQIVHSSYKSSNTTRALLAHKSLFCMWTDPCIVLDIARVVLRGYRF
jgi:hypothetical protein